MELRVTEDTITPGAFYGSALAALCGLLLGLLLHGPWRSHPGGPQILFASAAAAELARPASDDAGQASSAAEPPAAPAADAQLAELDTGYTPPDPLPVTRLAPDRFGSDDAEVQTAAFGDDGDDDQTADAAKAPAVPDFD